MRVRVTQTFVAMPMRVGFRYRTFMIMSMMPVVDMHVLMLQGFVLVLVVMPLRYMQPYAHGHQRSGRHKPHRQALRR